MESHDVMISVMNAGYESVNGAYKKEGASWIRRSEDGTQFVIGMDVIRDDKQALCLWEIESNENKILRYVDYMDNGPIGGIEDLNLEVVDAAEPVPQIVLINTYYATEEELKASEDAQLSEMSGGGGGGGMLGDNLQELADRKALRNNSATVWTGDQLDKLQEAMMSEMNRLGRDELWRRMDQNDDLRMVPQGTEKQVASDRIGWRLEPTQRPSPEELVRRGFLPAGYENVVKGSKDVDDLVDERKQERDSIGAKAVAAIQTRKQAAQMKEQAQNAMTWKFGQRADLTELIARGIVPPELAETVKGGQDYDAGSSAVKQRQEDARESLAGKLDLQTGNDE